MRRDGRRGRAGLEEKRGVGREGRRLSAVEMGLKAMPAAMDRSGAEEIGEERRRREGGVWDFGYEA